MSRPPDHVFVVGMSGSGKSTVGRLLANLLDRRFIDTDDEVVQRAGRSISEIFSVDGEETFRRYEEDVVHEVGGSSPPAVVAVAAGALADEKAHKLLSRCGRVIWLDASPETLRRHLGDGADRPLLVGSRDGLADAVRRLDAERRPLYRAVADAVVTVDGRRADEVTRAVADALLERIEIPLGERSYEVLVGPGARHRARMLLPERARRAAVVTQDEIPIDLELPIEQTRFVVGEGEKAKSLETVESLCRGFARAGLSRADVVIGLGGGLVTDVAGFAAACYHRGVAVAHVPTTLLGQVDAAIGGKTGVNLPEGKNLVGAFHQPIGVLCDTDTLVTLPEREWRSGFGEMAKYAFLGVERLDEMALSAQVAACVARKAAVVAEDERENGPRASLNYGHTLAHALETAGFAEREEAPAKADLRHGEAVGIGLVFAARLAERLGRIDARRVERHRALVAGYGLSTELPRGVEVERLVEFMGRDKKATDGLTFVLDGPRGVEVVSSLESSIVQDVLEKMQAESQEFFS